MRTLINLLMLWALTTSIAFAKGAEEFTTQVSYSRYEIVGDMDTEEEGKTLNVVLAVTVNPKMGIRVRSMNSIDAIISKIRTGRLARCQQISEKDKQAEINVLVPVIVQLPMFEAAVAADPNSTESTLQKLSKIKALARFHGAAGGDSRWYDCKL